MLRIASLAAVLAAGLLGTAPARATLGADGASVEADRLHLQAASSHAQRALYTVHELATPNGGLVREYVAPGGAVFAVTWHGPFMPNLRQLMGEHFARVTQSANRHSGGRSQLTVTEGNLVFASTGHIRSFHGQAYLSDAIPAGVSLDEIR